MKSLTVLFFGVQGSGKGTQVKLLMEAIKALSTEAIIHIDMGGLMRASIGSGSITGKNTAEIINVGKRMPDFMPIYLATKAFAEGIVTGNEHIVADGLCRGDDQTRGFDDAMTFYGRSDYHVISLDLSDAEAMKRLLARGRNDDTPEGIANRLAWYKTDVAPQLALMESRGRAIHRIDGDQNINVVATDILEVLGLRKMLQQQML
jgi:adenylate kinase